MKRAAAVVRSPDALTLGWPRSRNWNGDSGIPEGVGYGWFASARGSYVGLSSVGPPGSEWVENASLFSGIVWSQLWSGLVVESPLFPGIRSSVDGIGTLPKSPSPGDSHPLVAVNIGCSCL